MALSDGAHLYEPPLSLSLTEANPQPNETPTLRQTN
jgi:hypothetical protein